MEYVRDQLGIPEDMIVRYRGKTVGDMVEAVKACNGGVGVSVAFDMVGKDMKRLCLQATDFGARVVSIVSEGADFAGLACVEFVFISRECHRRAWFRQMMPRSSSMADSPSRTRRISL